MKKLLIGLLALGSISSFAADYKCSAVFNNSITDGKKGITSHVKKGELKNIRGRKNAGSREVVFSGYKFKVTEFDYEQLLMVIRHPSGKKIASSMSFVPTENKISLLDVALDDGFAMITCRDIAN